MAKKTTVKLRLKKETLQQLKKFENIDRELSDIINDYFIEGKGRSVYDGIAIKTILHRAYYNHKGRLNYKFTKEEFYASFGYGNVKFTLFGDDLKRIYKEYEQSGWDKYRQPSIRMANKLRDVRLTIFGEAMKNRKSTPVLVIEHGVKKTHNSINSVAKEFNTNYIAIKKALELGYYKTDNVEMFYA